MKKKLACTRSHTTSSTYTSQFCSTCGIKKTYIAYPICPSCKKDVIHNALFCDRCGHDLKHPVVKETPKQEEEKVPLEEQPVAKCECTVTMTSSWTAKCYVCERPLDKHDDGIHDLYLGSRLRRIETWGRQTAMILAAQTVALLIIIILLRT